MDTYFWIGGFGIIFILLFLPWYFLRSGTSRGEASLTPSTFKDDDPFIIALRSGDPVKIDKAPLPKHLTPELLLEVLYKLQIQPSLIDRIVERIRQQLTVRQFRLFVESWLRYYNRLGEAVKAQNEFFSQLSQRLNARLVHQRDQVILRAEIQEAKTRAWEAEQRRKPANKIEDSKHERVDPLERIAQKRKRVIELIEKRRAEEHEHIDKTIRDPKRRKEAHARADDKWDMELQRLQEQ